jgi:predicted MFS family arabinose efflux permease
VLGAYMACFDLGIALAGPVAGLVVSRSGLSSAFLAAASASFIALALLGSARLRMPASRA